MPAPQRHERQYFRHATTGDLGWLVEEDGKAYIRLDRPGGDEQLRPFRKLDWLPEHEHRPLSRAAIAHVAFDADRALAKALGLHDTVRKSWHDLSDGERTKWVENGPASPAVRKALRAAILAALEHA